MAATNSLTIFLLKEGNDPTNSLTQDNGLDAATASKLPPGGKLFVFDGDPYVPPWREYLGVKRQLHQVRKGAVLFVPAKKRWFAVTFGTVSHWLTDDAYEYDFGLRVTLNSVDPAKLKSADSVSPGSARRKRTQIPIEADLTVLDFDQNSDVIKSVAGKVRDQIKPLFSSVTGAESLRIRTRFAAHKLGELCSSLLDLYRCEDFRASFPDIQSIARIRDPSIVRTLDAKLLDAINSRSDSVNLTVPTLIDFGEGYSGRFYGVGAGPLFSDIYIQPYYAYLSAKLGKAAITADILRKSHKLSLVDADGQEFRRFNLYKCLVFDTCSDDGETYHLLDGSWYKIEKDYIKKLDTDLDPMFLGAPLPNYEHESEGAYNESIAANGTGIICLDKTNTSRKGETSVEPCDLISLNENRVVFWHVKRSTFSFKLSHLFSQGATAIELILQDSKAFDRLRSLLKRKAAPPLLAKLLWALEGRQYTVVYAIVTHKDTAAKSRNLPLFSRITLRRSARYILGLGARTHFAFIKDEPSKKLKEAG